MKNIYRPYECDICHSTDISVTTEYKDYTSKIVKYTKINEEVERFERSRIDKCRCKHCKNEFMINRGKDTFTRFLSSCYLTDNKDVCLLATYTSSVEDNYKVISVLNNQGITTYMAITDNDKYPIILSKKDTPKSIKESDKVLKLVKITHTNRYN